MKVEIRLTVAVLKDFPLENLECSKYQLTILTAEGGFVEAVPFFG